MHFQYSHTLCYNVNLLLTKRQLCYKKLKDMLRLGTDHLTCRREGGGGLWLFVSFRIFFQNSTLGYMTKTLNQTIFFSSTKIRIFFSATLGIGIFFFEKKIPPPPLPPFKLNGRFLRTLNLLSIFWLRVYISV